MAAYLVQTRWGRALLHLAAVLRGGHWSWHVDGILCELSQRHMSDIRQGRPYGSRDGEGP
jgi:hypothetical protein